jgi:hypothetical protein
VVVEKLDRTWTLYNYKIKTIDEKVKNRVDCPIHLVAYCLNHYYSFSDPSISDIEDVMDGFIAAIGTFYDGDYEKHNQVLNHDLHKFKDQVGHFGKIVAKAGYTVKVFKLFETTLLNNEWRNGCFIV